MSRWFVTLFALMACAIVNWWFGEDISVFVAAGLLALAFADEERQFENMDDNDEGGW